MKISQLLLMLVFAFLLSSGCGGNGDRASGETEVPPAERVDDDLPEIRKRGTLHALTAYSNTSYFLYRGHTLGYEYEMLQKVGEHLELDVEIHIASDINELFDRLENGEGDLIAYGLSRTADRIDRASFTLPFRTEKMVLVQRKPGNWRQMKKHEIEATLLRNVVNLGGKTVVVRAGSAYKTRLEALANEIGDDINIIEADPELTSDDLIEQVAAGEIDYTVADEHIARINVAKHPVLDVETPVSLDQAIAWAIRPQADLLLKAVNQWLRKNKGSQEFNVIYNKYFRNRSAYRSRARSDYFSGSATGRISDYDETIKKEAERLSVDWRLLASQIYQESRFNPRAKSWAGAVGLLQLMPKTAKEFGATDLNDPQQSIKVGVNYMIWLVDYWEETFTDPDDLYRIALASYNVGYNHVWDAYRLAEKYGKDPENWENIARFLELKQNEKYFNDPVAKFGYCRGSEPVQYVEEIYERYNHYSKLVEL
ncbi:transporter substrate-binding domain-containing protein [bacterium]|nr:transporter substrate-binding domain-containing protein [bacterium]